jgi:cell fate (sporulation/competence/biofilm development) regulator YlbF (YheA/YmcA/DUF963 family)
MRGFQRLTSAARGMLWLLRATGLRNHFSKLENHLTDLDAKVLYVASQSATAIRVADNVGRMERKISDVMADVSSQHATTVRVAESVQRLGKHIVDVAANNLTNGRLSEQFQKLEKHLNELGASHLANGRLTEQFQKLERSINEVVANNLNGKLTEQFHQLEKSIDAVMTRGQHHEVLRELVQKLEMHIADLAATERGLSERFQGLEQQLQAAAPLGQPAQHLERLEQHLAEIASDSRRQQDRTRWLQAQDLRAYERRVHSPNGEDGIIQEILHRIGVEARYFVEFGVKSGTESNCARLVLHENWIGLFVESDHVKFQQLTDCYHSSWGVRCLGATVSSRNIEHLLAENGVPFNLDVLSINIDGNDYWVWNALNRWRPRLIVIGYNSHFPPSKKWVMQENLDHKWDGTSYYGASLASLTALGRKKGYTLVATDSSGRSAFFVRDDLAVERFLDPIVHYHYSPPNLGPFLGGNPPCSGPHVEI